VNTSANFDAGLAVSRQGIQQARAAAPRSTHATEAKADATGLPVQQSESYQPTTEVHSTIIQAPDLPSGPQASTAVTVEKAAPYESPATTVLRSDGYPGSDVDRLLALKPPADPAGAEPLGYLTADGLLQDLKQCQTLQAQIQAEMEHSRLQRQQLMTSLFQEVTRGRDPGHEKAIKNLLDL
jgi:hypothetical protein